MAQKIVILKKGEKINFSDSILKSESSGKVKMKIWWLGQAGFYFEYENNSFFIDPYLSDSLAIKYKGGELPHIRMSPPPIHVEECHSLDFVFCTHGHGDHMDPGTLPAISVNNPHCKFIVPKAEKTKALERGVSENQIISVNAGESHKLNSNIKIDIIPAAHEDLKMNELEEFLYLGYIISAGTFTIYHSGDCIPYPGLSDRLKRFKIDLALLPVNGRDDYRSTKGIPGNFTIEEAITLCVESNIQNLLVHHFGMFSFNTVSEETLLQGIQQIGSENLNIIIPETDYLYELAYPIL